MANLYSAEYEKAHNDFPAQKLNQNEQGGKLLFAQASHTFDGEPSLNDVIKMIKLPKGAKVVDAIVYAPDLGTTGVLKLGHSASADGSIVANDDAFIPSINVTAAVSGLKMSEQVAGIAGRGQVFDQEVDIEFLVSTATDAADGLTIVLELFYVMQN